MAELDMQETTNNFLKLGDVEIKNMEFNRYNGSKH